MGKFKEIDLFCKNEDKEGLIAFLAEHGITNPHKQANIYLEEYRMNKTVKISDINKEIAAEMQEEHIYPPSLEYKEPEVEKIETLSEMCNILSQRISNLSKMSDILDEKINVVNERIDNIMDYFNKKSGG